MTALLRHAQPWRLPDEPRELPPATVFPPHQPPRFRDGFPVADFAASLEQQSEHPIGAAIMANARLPHWARWRLALTMAMVGVGHVVGLGRAGDRAAELTSAAVLTRALLGSTAPGRSDAMGSRDVRPLL